jgi:hypothetical protein
VGLRLVPVPPHAGAAVTVPLAGDTFWIGAAADAGLPLFLPGVGARHAALVGRADGPWVVPQRAAAGAVRRNGAALDAAAPLAHGDVVEFAPGVAYRVELAGARTGWPERASVVSAPPPPPAPAARSPLSVRARGAWQRWRRRPRRRGARVAAAWWALAAVALACAAAAAVLLWRAARPAADTPAPLTERQAAEYDALVARAADRTERGVALLELGLPDAALREFGAAVTEIESSSLRDNPWVRPRLDALEAGIAAVYRERRVPVPARYAAAATRRRGTLPAAPALVRAGRLSTADFAAHLAQVREAFAARYGRPLVVTGADHAEHVALYGAGGAVDLRVRDLTGEQVAFVRDALRARGVRVKDFSQDSVLRAQVAAARAAGLGDRAGTGLHLHADRFPDRVDRWTVR